MMSSHWNEVDVQHLMLQSQTPSDGGLVNCLTINLIFLFE